MKKILLILMVVALVGCAAFERAAAEVKRDKQNDAQLKELSDRLKGVPPRAR